jgi:S-methylmethionine-dependent homocysteine/selenocysteine methylase
VSNRPTIGSRLDQGDLLLLDGGTGSELQRRGINIARGVSAADDGTLGAWSATAVEEAPEVVSAIHEDYLRVGADIVTANSYNTNRGQLASVGQADRMEEFSRVAVTLAVEARDKMNPDAYVAGSIAPTNRFPHGWDPDRVAPADELARDWGDQTDVLADAGADLILIETMSAIFQLLPAVQAARNTGLPVFLGIHATAEGTMTSGETIEQLMEALSGREPDAILLMCRPPEHISATMPGLREAFSGPVGAYADIGYGRDPDPTTWRYHTIDIGSNTPRRYAEFGREWLDAGAQIIGGCCATTPEHIAALRPLLSATPVA